MNQKKVLYKGGGSFKHNVRNVNGNNGGYNNSGRLNEDGQYGPNPNRKFKSRNNNGTPMNAQMFNTVDHGQRDNYLNDSFQSQSQQQFYQPKNLTPQKPYRLDKYGRVTHSSEREQQQPNFAQTLNGFSSRNNQSQSTLQGYRPDFYQTATNQRSGSRGTSPMKPQFPQPQFGLNQRFQQESQKQYFRQDGYQTQNNPQKMQYGYGNQGGQQYQSYVPQGARYKKQQNDIDFYHNESSVYYYFDLYSKNMDNLYREPKDGMISLRKNNGVEVVVDKNPMMVEGIPEIELVTLIDLSTLWEDKQQLAGQIALQMCNLNHANLLNITRQLRYLDNSEMHGGFLQFSSEAPDHISSWKSFCKRPFDLHQTISIFRQLCDGVSHIHDQNMIFRDVHPTRIHLKNGVIKLNLVGMPYNFKKLLKNESFSGHLNYSAPEILESGTENYLSHKVDVWSLGCCLYYLATKRDPFDGQNPAEIKFNIRHGRIDRYEKDFGMDDKENPRHFLIEQLLSYCLTFDINQRPSARQMVQIIDDLVLQHISVFQQQQAPSSDVKLAQQQQSNESYQNKLMNKNIPEFFAKRNNFDPIFIKPLSVVENHKKILKVVKVKDPVLIPGFKKFTIESEKSESKEKKSSEHDTPVFQNTDEFQMMGPPCQNESAIFKKQPEKRSKEASNRSGSQIRVVSKNRKIIKESKEMLIREEYNVQQQQQQQLLKIQQKNDEELYRQRSENTKLMIPAPNGFGESEFNRQQSAPVDNKALTPGLPAKQTDDMNGERSPQRLAPKKGQNSSPHRGSQQTSQKSLLGSKNSAQIMKIRQDQIQSPLSPDIHNLQDKSSQYCASNKGSQEDRKSKKGIWNQSLRMMITPQEGSDYIHTSSLGSGGTVAQEMMDMVDNLIDASPNSRVDMYDKSQFHLKVMQTGFSDAIPQEPVGSVGILKYDSGDIYEGQLLNGKRSGQGKMTFGNGDKYIGMWKSDQMCDPEGVFSFKNGNEYRGSFRTCSKLTSKYGCFEGAGTLRLVGMGTFEGYFKNGKIHGPGIFELNNGKDPIEKNWQHTSIDELIEQLNN